MRTSGLIRLAKMGAAGAAGGPAGRDSAAALRSAAADSVDAGALDRGRSAEWRVWTPPDRIAASLPRWWWRARITVFWLQRFGIDTAALQAQVVIRFNGAKLEGDDARGASTITMQLARNLFLPPSRNHPAPRGRAVADAASLPSCGSKRRVIESI